MEKELDLYISHPIYIGLSIYAGNDRNISLPYTCIHALLEFSWP